MSLPQKLQKTMAIASGGALRSGRRWLGAGLKGLVELVYPPSCIACRAATEQAQGLCAACWSGIGFIERPFCERLGTPFVSVDGRVAVAPDGMVGGGPPLRMVLAGLAARSGAPMVSG